MKSNGTGRGLGIFMDGFLNSYSQIFFSNNKVFSGILILISFFDIGAGLSGVISIVTAQLTIVLFGFNREHLRTGSYTYNVLMVGIALGIFYEFNLSSVLLLLISAVLTVFFTVWMSVSLEKKGLPFLSIPFLIGIWIVLLGASNFSSVALNEKEELSLMAWFPGIFSRISDSVGSLPAGDALHLYFRSLGAIFFQYNDLAGILIALGILYYSRIAFGLSLFGFSIGYLFYILFEGDFSQLIYSYIGFNFILTSIALGGFFIVPSGRSYLMLLFTIPVIAILISALYTIFSAIGIPMYSLPFNIVSLLFIATMLTRYKSSGINLVTEQSYSPEKNHYKFINSVNRFKDYTYYHITLPIIGNWRVSQGHNGKITHKGDWQYAWDFDIVDEQEKTYREPGHNVEDYYCYNLPVIAPADGYVVEILDGIDDNKISDVNLKDNWGNTIIIKHAEQLYSKLSHLKKGSFTVKTGDTVTRGQKLAACGSSGRSPEPHLHFQLQATPFIGSKTLKFPVSYFLNTENGEQHFNTFTYPKENDVVSNVKTCKLLMDAFGFIPGKIMKFKYENEEYVWEVFTNVLNRTYIYCSKTQSYAYFVNDGIMFYFTDFYGKKGSLLHHFYYGAYKVLLGYYEGVTLKEELMIDGFFNKLIKSVHDFTAPFFHYCKLKYSFYFKNCDHPHNPDKIEFETKCSGFLGKRIVKEQHYSFELKEGRIHTFRINNNTAQCID